jgi:hypothetical protein
MLNNFTVKLSKHKHADEHCIRTVTFDDYWKIARSKCYYDQMTLKTEELESIQLGCTQTPSRLSYYCPNHKNYEF